MTQEGIAGRGESVFRNKNYVLLFLGSVVSNIGNMLYNFAISLYILDITNANAIIAGIYLATGGVVYAILAPFGGAIVDRLDRVKVVYITDFIRGAVILIAGYLLLSGITISQQIILLFVCTIILAINGALFGPASTALPANILEENQLQQSNSLASGANALYNIIGVFFGAALYQFFGIEIVFIANGLTFILSGISELFITTKTKQDPNHVVTFGSVTKDISSGLKYLVKLKPILYLMIVAMLLNFFITPSLTNGMPYLFNEELKVSPFYYSLIMATFPVGIIIASLILGSQAQKPRIFGMLKWGLIGTSGMFILFTVNTHIHLLDLTTFTFYIITAALIMVITGIFNGYVNIPFGTVIQVQVEKQMQGRVFSVLNVISMGLTPVSIALGGIVIAKLGILALFYIGGITIMILSLYAAGNKYIKQL